MSGLATLTLFHVESKVARAIDHNASYTVLHVAGVSSNFSRDMRVSLYLALREELARGISS